MNKPFNSNNHHRHQTEMLTNQSVSSLKISTLSYNNITRYKILLIPYGTNKVAYITLHPQIMVVVVVLTGAFYLAHGTRTITN